MIAAPNSAAAEERHFNAAVGQMTPHTQEFGVTLQNDHDPSTTMLEPGMAMFERVLSYWLTLQRLVWKQPSWTLHMHKYMLIS